jgi:hypothetical protein
MTRARSSDAPQEGDCTEEDARTPRDDNDDDDASLFGGSGRSSDENSNGNNDVMASNAPWEGNRTKENVRGGNSNDEEMMTMRLSLAVSAATIGHSPGGGPRQGGCGMVR